MKLSDFHYDLPDELIARYPVAERSHSRLMRMDTAGHISHHHFYDVIDFLRPHDLLVLNNTKVLKARLLGKKSSGGAVELLLERLIDDSHCLMHAKSNKPIKPGLQVFISDEIIFEAIENQNGLWLFKFTAAISLEDILENHGHVPLPPYFRREDEIADVTRYQTVFALNPGAVAAPTAGLHFDEALLEKIKTKGIDVQYLTLHVGAGTFKPVKVEDVTNHVMHEEHYEITPELVTAIQETKKKGGRIVACGTTVTRALETWARLDNQTAIRGSTKIFIYPGIPFKCVDVLITNFHLPDSTLMMLVSAFAGTSHILKAYQTAIENRYRFFSFGDAMILGAVDISRY